MAFCVKFCFAPVCLELYEAWLSKLGDSELVVNVVGEL